MTDTEHLPVLVLVRDLLLSSQIKVSADHAKLPVLLLRDPATLAAAKGRKLIIDCNLDGAIPAAASYRTATGIPVIGFVSHVDIETIALARNSGIDRLLARSAFFADVASFLE